MYCIVLTGPPGAGKSTLLSILSSNYHYKTYDVIDFYSQDSNFSEQEIIDAFNNMLAKINETMLSKEIIIIEGFFYADNRLELLKEICGNNHYKLVLIYLTANPLDLVKRVKQRDEKRINNRITEDKIFEFFKKFKNIKADITINTMEYNVFEIEKMIINILNKGDNCGN
jgi:predicted kinase